MKIFKKKRKEKKSEADQEYMIRKSPRTMSKIRLNEALRKREEKRRSSSGDAGKVGIGRGSSVEGRVEGRQVGRWKGSVYGDLKAVNQREGKADEVGKALAGLFVFNPFFVA